MADQPDPEAPEATTTPDGAALEPDDTPSAQSGASVPESAADARRRLDGHGGPSASGDRELDEDDEGGEDEGRDTDGPDLPGWLCRGCAGTGVRRGKECPLCKGTGGLRPDDWDEEADKPKTMPPGAPSWWCKQCAGTGKLRNGQQCPSCLGTGGVTTA